MSQSESEMESAGAQSSSKKPESKPVLGSVKRMKLKNFMCHGQLDLKFNSNVNFIIGRNGSGKSAVLAGLVIGLGGKASTMNRGHAVRNYIRNGANSAEISITLNNGDADADGYKPAEYGDEITIERKLLADGGGGYKIKDAKGAVKSTRKEDLVRILDRFNIQLDNPLVILNQDTSRSFLQSAKSDELYKFFMRGTMFEQMCQDFALVNETVEESSTMLDQKKAVLSQLETVVRQLREKYQFHASLDEQRLKLQLLEREVAWAQIMELEEKRESLIRKMKFENKKKNELVNQKTTVNEAKEESDDRYKALEAECLKLRTDFEKNVPNMDRAKEELTKSKQNLSVLKIDERKVIQDIKNVENEKADLVRQMEGLMRENQTDNSDDIEKCQVELAKTKQKIQQAESKFKEAEMQQNTLESSQRGLREEIEKLRAEDASICRNIAAEKEEMARAERGQKDRTRRFGDFVPEILLKMEEAHKLGKFQKKPRGPLGLHVSIKDENWAPVIEKSLGGLLKSFVCDNWQDSRELEKIMAPYFRNSRRPQIIVSKFGAETPYDISRNEPAGYPTILSMLVIDDVVVRNTLIDQRGIESVILVADLSRLNTLMRLKEVARCSEAYHIKGDQCYAEPHRYYSQRGQLPLATMLVKNVGDAIAQRSENISRFEKQRQEIQPKTAEKAREKSHIDAELRKLSGVVQELQKEINFAKRRTVHLEKEIEDLQPMRVDLNALQQDVSKLDVTRLENEDRLAQITDLIQNAEREIRQKLDALNEIRKIGSELMRKADPLEDDLKAADAHSKQLLGDITKIERQIGTIDQIINKLYDAQREVEGKLEGLLATVDSTTRPDEVSGTSVEIEKQIIRLRTTLQGKEDEMGSKEEITRMYTEKREKYKMIKDEIKRLRGYVKRMEEAMETREVGFRTLRAYSAIKVKILFTKRMAERGFNGKAHFCHASKKIDLHVETNNVGHGKGGKENVDHRSKPRTQDLKGLSGGERSFSTVSFVLAMWDAMDSPIRCMDEFDVFMDMVNRRHAMAVLMNFALNSFKSNQFIFLTPLDMSKIDTDPRISFFRLEEPRKEGGAKRMRMASGSEEAETDGSHVY